MKSSRITSRILTLIVFERWGVFVYKPSHMRDELFIWCRREQENTTSWCIPTQLNTITMVSWTNWGQVRFSKRFGPSSPFTVFQRRTSVLEKRSVTLPSMYNVQPCSSTLGVLFNAFWKVRQKPTPKYWATANFHLGYNVVIFRKNGLQWSSEEDTVGAFQLLVRSIIGLVVDRVCLAWNKLLARIGPQTLNDHLIPYLWYNEKRCVFLSLSKQDRCAALSHHQSLTPAFIYTMSVGGGDGIVVRAYRGDEPDSSLTFYHLYKKDQADCLE